MRILLLSPLPPPIGGIATWTSIFLNSKELKKYKVDIVNTSILGERKNKRIDLYNEFKRSGLIIINLLKKISKKPQIVHLNTSCGSKGIFRDYICAIIVKKLKLKLLIQYHCNIDDMIKNNFQKKILKKLLVQSDINLVLNKDSKQYLKKIGYDSKIIPNFVSEKNFNKFLYLRKKERINRIIYTGRIRRDKGCLEILEVAKEFPNIEFILIGNLEEDFSEMKKSTNVKFLGVIKLEEVYKELEKGDIFLFPSYSEGFPNSVLEAMTYGLPIIATNVGALEDMIENKGGFLLKTLEITEIKEKISLLDTNFKLRFEMGKWNREKVKKYYLEEVVIKKILKIYEEGI